MLRYLKLREKQPKKKNKMQITTDKFSGANTVNFKIRFSKGGINYFNYKNEQKGFYVHCQPMTVTQKDGYSTEEYTMGTGFKILLSEESRDSKKKLQKYNEVLNKQESITYLQDACNTGDLNIVAKNLKAIFDLEPIAA